MARRPAEPGLDRRQQILEAALDVFAEQGYEGATTKAIATHADVTQGLIYFYFPDGKKELFAAAFEQQAALLYEQLEVDDAEHAETPEILLPRLIARFVEVMSEPRRMCVLRLMTRATIREGADGSGAAPGRERLHALGLHVTDRLRAYLDTQVARGTLRPINTSLTAHLIMSALVMTLMRRTREHVPAGAEAPEDFAAALADVFLHGILAGKPEPVAPVSAGHARKKAPNTQSSTYT